MFEVQNSKNILVIKLGALGDVMMSEGVMRCVRQAFPEAQITLITEPLYARFMANAPHFDDIIAHKRAGRMAFGEFRKLKKQLKARHFDLVIDLQNSSYSKRILGWLRNSKISSTARNVDYRYFQDKTRKIPIRNYLKEQIEMIGVDPAAGNLPDLRWAAENVEHLLAGPGLTDGFVLLVAGSSKRHQRRRWDKYSELSSHLQKRGFMVVTAPGPDELDLCSDLPAHMLLDDGKPLTFKQMIGLSAHCTMVIGNDTGPTHMMAASGTSGVALVGSNNSPAWQTGVADVYEVIEKSEVRDISVDEVLAAVDKIQSNSV